MDPRTRDSIITKERHRYRNRLLFSLLGVIVAPLGVPLTVMAERRVPLPDFLLAFPPLSSIITVGVGLLIIALGIGLNPVPDGADAPDVVDRQIETIQNRHRWLLVLLAAIPLSFAAEVTFLPRMLPRWSGYAGQAEPGTIRLFVIMIVCALPVVLIGFHRPGLDTYHGAVINDELTRMLRLQAIRIGYAAVMLALAGTYAGVMWGSINVRQVLPWILAGGIAVPALSLAFLDWRAGREK